MQISPWMPPAGPVIETLAVLSSSTVHPAAAPNSNSGATHSGQPPPPGAPAHPVTSISITGDVFPFRGRQNSVDEPEAVATKQAGVSQSEMQASPFLSVTPVWVVQVPLVTTTSVPGTTAPVSLHTT